MIAKITVLAIFGTLFASALASPTSRVVGGDIAEPGAFPYQVSVRFENSHICGGSIISANYILTAAHCVIDETGKPDPASEFTIRVGSNNRLAGGVIHSVRTITVHNDHNGIDFLNDVALMRTTRAMVFSDRVQPIALATEEVPDGSDVIISGWGLEETDGANLPYLLKWNTLKAISQAECFHRISHDSPLLICLDHTPGNGACHGDSGGPAVYDGKLVGIAGFVKGGLCGSTVPDGYAKVSKHTDWINANMRV